MDDEIVSDTYYNNNNNEWIEKSTSTSVEEEKYKLQPLEKGIAYQLSLQWKSIWKSFTIWFLIYQ